MPAVAANECTDGELITRSADGDRDAFEVLYRRYSRPVFGLALRRVGGPGRAGVAVRVNVATRWRAAPSEQPQRGASDAGPDERAESSWTAWRVHRALEELSPNERTVVELAYWSGLSQSEIAEFLNIPLGTVKTRTRAALHRRSGLLEEELG